MARGHVTRGPVSGGPLLAAPEIPASKKSPRAAAGAAGIPWECAAWIPWGLRVLLQSNYRGLILQPYDPMYYSLRGIFGGLWGYFSNYHVLGIQ